MMTRLYLTMTVLSLLLTTLTGRSMAYETTIEDAFGSPTMTVVTTDPTTRTYAWDLVTGQVGLTSQTVLTIPSNDGYVATTTGSSILLTGEEDFDEGEISCWVLPCRDGITRIQGVMACVSDTLDPSAAAPGYYIAGTYLTTGVGQYFVRIWLNCPAAGNQAFPGIGAETVEIDDPGDTFHKLAMKVDRTSTTDSLTVQLYWDEELKLTFAPNPWWNAQIGTGKVGLITWFSPESTPASYDMFSATWLNDPVPVSLSCFELK